jgi:hypothetical protein
VTTPGSAHRQLLAVALIGAIGFVLVGPLFHSDHHDAGSPADPRRHSDLHVCSSGAHGAGPMGICPTCLSHRLLNQAQIERSGQPPLMGSGPGIEAGRLPLIAIFNSCSLRPRAPPTV